MWLPRVVDLRYPILCLLIAAEITMGLRSVNVSVPYAVKRGETALLMCRYDMEGDSLYSVKWYKGRREFYRYTPKENPSMKTFPLGGVFVERSLSNESQVVLSSVELSTSGKYSCEVSADAPSFHTEIVSEIMEIVELPEHNPSITGIHTRYRPGDILQGNCSSDYSRPAANLTWIINDVPASVPQIKPYRHIKDIQKNTESSILGLHIVIQHQHFIRGKLKIRCMAQVYNIYEQSEDKIIEEDRPRILATGTSGHNMNLFQSQPYDQSSSADTALNDQDELYLTHYKADNPSAATINLLSNIIAIIFSIHIVYPLIIQVS